MYLHIRKSANADSLVVTLRESYRDEYGKVKKRQHHVASITMTAINEPAYRGSNSRRRRFWRDFDKACDRLNISAKDRREFARIIREAGVPKRPAGMTAKRSLRDVER